jgi:hypothetical protein
MTRTDHTAPVPDLYLERYLLGELPEEERGRIERLVDLDPELRGRLDTLKRSDSEVAQRYPAREVAERIRGRARVEDAAAPRRATSFGQLTAVWLAPAVAAATVVLAVGAAVVPTPSPGDGILLKGAEAELVVFRKTASGSERLEAGAPATPGDLIRVGYRAAGQAYGAIVSTDGHGSVTQHLPSSGGRAASLETGGTVLLESSYELDDAPRWERFYFVTGGEPFGLDLVRQAARRVATTGSETAPPTLELPRGLEQSVFSLTKESRR